MRNCICTVKSSPLPFIRVLRYVKILVFFSLISLQGFAFNGRAGVVKKDGNHKINQIVKGVVRNEKGQALGGVSIKVKGKSGGTSTAADGSFSIDVKAGDVLIFSYVGYSSVELNITTQSSVEVTLKEGDSKLDEIVVVGYGTQKKANLTGAVQVITSKDLENRPATNVTALLQGNANGIAFSSPSSGFAPGAAQTIAIRGTASLNSSTPPLVVIDGIPTNMEDFNTLNPDDVESITVLKDAAASAIYGSRAPYGVLMVTLKKGRRNQKPVLTYSGNYSIVKPVNYPNPQDAYTFALVRNESYLNSQQSVYFNPDQLAIIKGNVENPGKYTQAELVPLLADGSWGWGQNGMANTNWFKVWLKNSQRQSHELSLRGGPRKPIILYPPVILINPAFSSISQILTTTNVSA